MAVEFKSKIVGNGTAPASSLLANEKNWRIHPKSQQDALTAVLGEVGWVQQVIVNKRTDASWGRDRNVETVVDGHARIILSLRQGDDTEVPIVFVDLSPEEEAKVLATFDPLGAMATADAAKLDDLLRDVQTGDVALQEMLAKLAEDAGLYAEPAEITEDEVPEPPTVPVTKPGDLIVMGRTVTCPKCKGRTDV